MKIHTFTVVVGPRGKAMKACNMKCQYCVSKMTPEVGPDAANDRDSGPPNLRNFHVACRFAQISNVSTVLFTGKGEPTLWPDILETYLTIVDRYSFPFRELQTNGVLLDHHNPHNHLNRAKEWYKLGMTLVCLSVAHYDGQKNTAMLRPSFSTFDYWRAVNALHEIGFSVRVNCTLTLGGVDSAEHLEQLREKCQQYGVEQITVRMVAKPDEAADQEVARWVAEHQFDDSWLPEYITETHGVELLNLPHGATVFDWKGQNICVSTCLTETKDRDDIRQMIYFPNGRLSYSWNHQGAVIL